MRGEWTAALLSAPLAKDVLPASDKNAGMRLALYLNLRQVGAFRVHPGRVPQIE